MKVYEGMEGKKMWAWNDDSVDHEQRTWREGITVALHEGQSSASCYSLFTYKERTSCVRPTEHSVESKETGNEKKTLFTSQLESDRPVHIKSPFWLSYTVHPLEFKLMPFYPCGVVAEDDPCTAIIWSTVRHPLISNHSWIVHETSLAITSTDI
jgi:hypothetical protein